MSQPTKPQRLIVHPIQSLRAQIAVSGDKSISHRAVILGSLASGITRIENFLASHDCLATIHAFQSLGVEIEILDDNKVYIEGSGGRLSPCGEPIDCGNSGTTMRLLSGVLAGHGFRSRLVGDESLHRRPMRRVAEPLGLMGANVRCEGKDGRPPLIIEGSTELQAIDYTTPVPSAQIKSAVLLAGLQSAGVTTVRETERSRDHTERMLRRFGASISCGLEYKKAAPQNASEKPIGFTTSVLGGQRLHGCDLSVPGDFSSAAFWIVAAAAMPDSDVILHHVGFNPTRTGLLNVLSRMGAQFHESVTQSQWEPVGNLTITGGPALHGTTVEGSEIPNVIDEIPILAVAAALAGGVTTIRDAAELRVKESDRLSTVAEMLRAFGVPVEEYPDGLSIIGGAPLRGATVHSHGDHRIAMSAAILGLFAEGRTVVEDVDCIQTSYPTFTRHLASVLESNPGRQTKLSRLIKRLTPKPASPLNSKTIVPDEDNEVDSSPPPSEPKEVAK